jgi:hypothetical protein
MIEPKNDLYTTRSDNRNDQLIFSDEINIS